MNFIFKHLERLFSAKRFLVHCANAGYRLVLLACLVVSGPVIGANVEAKPLHFDCERVEAGFKTPLNVGGGLVLIEPDGGKVWCESSAQPAGCLTSGGDKAKADGVVKLNGGVAEYETKGNQNAKQGAGNAKAPRHTSNLIGGKFHDYLIIAGGGFGGIAIGLLLGLAIIWLQSSNVEVKGGADERI